MKKIFLIALLFASCSTEQLSDEIQPIRFEMDTTMFITMDSTFSDIAALIDSTEDAHQKVSVIKKQTQEVKVLKKENAELKVELKEANEIISLLDSTKAPKKKKKTFIQKVYSVVKKDTLTFLYEK